MKPEKSSRLLALDILRGITIAGMILVNNPGSWGSVYAPLRHAAWNGLTPTDLVFPFFMFIMGISTYISLYKFNFECTKPTLYKILKRTLLIFLIGLVLAWISLSFRTYHSLANEQLPMADRLVKAITNFENIRILGVMQRLALSYGATALIAILVKHKHIPYIIFGILTGYFLLLLFGNGFELSNDNILGVIDRAILGASHMYKQGGIAFDPEGLTSTIPCIAHVLIGFYCGKLLLNTKDNHIRITQLFIVGAILTVIGFLLSYGCPVNKNIWSPTYVLVTCGLASTFLALLIWIIDIKGYKKWSVFFESFGVNPLFIYVMGVFLAILANGIRFNYDDSFISLQGYIYKICLLPYMGEKFASLLYALLFVTFNWVIGNILYKKKIYIKL